MNLFNKLLMKVIKYGDKSNMILGVALIVSLLLIYIFPNNQIAILSACISGGLMNIVNGLKMIRDPKKLSTGMTFLAMGVLIIVLGFIIIKFV
ncbi:MAG: hypothetical protein WBI07_16285 [Mobilitalea sp.]